MRPLLCALALFAAACTPGSGTTTIETAVPTTPPTAAATTATLPPVTTTPVDPCPDGGPAGDFTASGPLQSLGTAAGDAAVISGIAVTTPRPGPGAPVDPDACERLVLELATERGAPATAVGTTEVELLAELGIVRIGLPPAVTETALADVTLGGNYAHRAFVVQAGDRLFVDVHLARPGTVRAEATRSPATIVLDVIGGGTVPETRPAAGSDAVVLEPLGPMAAYPLAVTGYARSAGGSVEVAISANGSNLDPIPVEVGDHPWHSFVALLPTGPTGSVRLTVGDVVVLLAVP